MKFAHLSREKKKKKKKSKNGYFTNKDPNLEMLHENFHIFSCLHETFSLPPR